MVEKNGKYESTIAGVSKQKGHEFFSAHGFDAFRIGTVIEDAGNMAATYNDSPIHRMTVTDYNGITSEFTTASNLCLIETPYTLGITKDYAELLDM